MKKTLTAAAAAVVMAPAGDAMSGMTSITRTGTVHLNLPPEHVFPLFTAPGERLWVPGWDPQILTGGHGLERGSVWLTGNGVDRTIWLVVDYDPESLHARYARITPESRAGWVEVFVRPDGEGGADVDVTYQLTALNEHGIEFLAEFDEDAYAQMMAEWEKLIRAANLEYPVRFEN
jgi:hypothetical protein